MSRRSRCASCRDQLSRESSRQASIRAWRRKACAEAMGSRLGRRCAERTERDTRNEDGWLPRWSTLVPVVVHASPVKDGRAATAVAVYRDVTAHKRLDEEREAWTSVVAHDLRQPATEVAQLFQRFYRTRGAASSKRPGLGLGLFISKGIVEAHGGSIAVESIPGETTTFRCRLPGGEAGGA